MPAKVEKPWLQGMVHLVDPSCHVLYYSRISLGLVVLLVSGSSTLGTYILKQLLAGVSPSPFMEPAKVRSLRNRP